MRLADFILVEMEQIVVQWEAFAAAQLPAAAGMSSLALRDHARQILEAVAKDLSTAQTREQQSEKSLGRAPVLVGAPETAAQTHAVLRAQGGFDIKQLAAEYRALRASVLRLWTDAFQPDHTYIGDIMRFNEAIDQALAESIGFFSAQVEESRNLFLGMLGHDLRSPLQTIQMTASFLNTLNAGSDVSEAAGRLMHSGSRMQALLNDMIDFNRTKLGLGINIAPAKVDLSQVFTQEVNQLRGLNPQIEVKLNLQGDLRGMWDARRLQQLLTNLVRNAIQYGEQNAPVQVKVSGDDAEVRIEVQNHGPVIPAAELGQLFEPLKRGSGQQYAPIGDGNLGLGLYIVREIAKSHGGSVDARSKTSETVFTVRLPRCRS
jgi:signal transduction histidine kinase